MMTNKVKLLRTTVMLFPTQDELLESLANKTLVRLLYKCSADQYEREMLVQVMSLERGGPEEETWTFVGKTDVVQETHFFRAQLPEPNLEGRFSWLW